MRSLQWNFHVRYRCQEEFFWKNKFSPAVFTWVECPQPCHSYHFLARKLNKLERITIKIPKSLTRYETMLKRDKKFSFYDNDNFSLACDINLWDMDNIIRILHVKRIRKENLMRRSHHALFPFLRPHIFYHFYIWVIFLLLKFTRALHYELTFLFQKGCGAL